MKRLKSTSRKWKILWISMLFNVQVSQVLYIIIGKNLLLEFSKYCRMWCQRIHLDLFSHRCVKLWPICQSACIGPLRGDWTFSLHGMPRTIGILVRKNSSKELWKNPPSFWQKKLPKVCLHLSSNNFSLRFDRKNVKIIPLWFNEYFLHFSATLVMILLSMTRLMENWTVLGPIWLN